ncbi:MAG: 30S ribosomal protein S1 [Candidatus Omnitrophica bacterium]|nr:30S ribosomal protein S1 [Candidatus Omnitrophota bacterium]
MHATNKKEISKEVNLEDLSFLYEQSIKKISEGNIAKGKIISIGKKDVIVDIGYKSEGVISISEFDRENLPEIGEEINVLVESLENDEGMVVISKRKADKIRGWKEIIDNFKEGDTIEGKISRKVKGGLMVDVGMEAFLPASLVYLHGYGKVDQLIGEKILFKIIKINKPRRNIVVSRKDYLIQEREEKKKKLLSELEEGQTIKGKVKNITDFGVFINLGGVDGLLHITDMSWGRISHPSEMLAVGDEIEVVILGYDKKEGKISLGLKQKTPNPWEDVESKYPVGSKAKGKVVNLVPYGAFVELEKGIEGLVHISELSWTKRINNPSEILAIGDIVEAVVLNIDKDKRKISLGIKQTEANPWEDVATRYPVDSKIKGKVRNVTDYGVFVEIIEGIDGLINVCDISWTNKNVVPGKIFKKGQRVEAVILNIDAEVKRISLGLKQLMPNPWPMIAKRYKSGKVCDGTIVKITDFGIFVEIEENLEGLLPLDELSQEPSVNLQESYKVGQKIKVEISEVDEKEGKITLKLSERKNKSRKSSSKAE